MAPLLFRMSQLVAAFGGDGRAAPWIDVLPVSAHTPGPDDDEDDDDGPGRGSGGGNIDPDDDEGVDDDEDEDDDDDPLWALTWSGMGAQASAT